MENTGQAIWSKSNKAWGSARRVQRNAYAWRVSMVMTEGRVECPSCGGPLDTATAEVDRVVPALDYRPRNICYVCRACNESRGVLQSQGSDWARVADYARAVEAASASVEIPTYAESRDWWRGRGGETRTSRWA